MSMQFDDETGAVILIQGPDATEGQGYPDGIKSMRSFQEIRQDPEDRSILRVYPANGMDRDTLISSLVTAMPDFSDVILEHAANHENEWPVVVKHHKLDTRRYRSRKGSVAPNYWAFSHYTIEWITWNGSVYSDLAHLPTESEPRSDQVDSGWIDDPERNDPTPLSSVSE